MEPEEMEIVKRHQDEFGGLQFELLDLHEAVWRMCAARGCGWPGRVQLTQPRVHSTEPRSYRLLCASHFVQLVFLTDAFLGNPSPATEAKAMADFLGLGGDPLAKWKNSIAVVFNPAFARCAECGGGFVAETIGMYSGKRYVHTCGVEKGGAGA